MIIFYSLSADIYSQISDSNGHMIHWRFSEYLKEVLALTAAVYETPSFVYSEGLASTIFPPVTFFFHLSHCPRFEKFSSFRYELPIKVRKVEKVSSK